MQVIPLPFVLTYLQGVEEQGREIIKKPKEWTVHIQVNILHIFNILGVLSSKRQTIFPKIIGRERRLKFIIQRVTILRASIWPYGVLIDNNGISFSVIHYHTYHGLKEDRFC